MSHHEYQALPRRQPRDFLLEHVPSWPPYACSSGPGPSSGVFNIRTSASSVNGAQPAGACRRRWSMQAFMTMRYSHDVTCASCRNRSSAAIHLDEDVLGDILGIVMIAGELVGHPIHHRRGDAPPAHGTLMRHRPRRGSRVRIRRRAEAAVHCQRYDGHTVVRVDRSGTLDGGFGVCGSGFGVWFGVRGRGWVRVRGWVGRSGLGSAF